MKLNPNFLAAFSAGVVASLVYGGLAAVLWPQAALIIALLTGFGCFLIASVFCSPKRNGTGGG